jgi:hypothetical protein
MHIEERDLLEDKNCEHVGKNLALCPEIDARGPAMKLGKNDRISLRVGESRCSISAASFSVSSRETNHGSYLQVRVRRSSPSAESTWADPPS